MSLAKGLTYKKPNNSNSNMITISLFDSYKRVTLGTYLFDNNDVVNESAISYYRSMKSLGVELVTDTSTVDSNLDKGEVKTVIEVDSEVKAKDIEIKKEEQVKVVTEMSELGDFTDATDQELMEYLDINYHTSDDIIKLAEELDYQLPAKVKKKDKLIDNLVSNCKDRIISYLNNK